MLPTDRPYLIGETAFHHQGDLNFLKELIDAAENLKLDAIKFHLLLDIEDYMIKDHKAINTLRPWCFEAEQWTEILKYADGKNLDLILLCNDVKSIEWVNQLNIVVRAIEIHATGINDVFLLDKATIFDGTVILGTGGSTINEIQYAVDYLKKHGQNDIFLMHGFQNYPTNPSDIRLSRMKILSDLFQLPVGYADHSDPKDINNTLFSVMGVSMGYNVLEKHYTHKYGEERVDSQSAISIKQLEELKQIMEIAYKVYGQNPLDMSEAEKKYGDTGPMKKAIVAKRKIAAGTLLTLDNMAFKRTNESTSIKQWQLSELLGLSTRQEIKKDEIIDFSKVYFSFKQNSFDQFKK